MTGRMNMENNILQIKNLTKKFDSFTLDDISLSLPKGSVMGFVGENGAGKTTTIKLILNELKKDAGSIKVFGLDSVRDEIAIKEDIGVVFSENHFNENFDPEQIGKLMSLAYKRWDMAVYKDYLKKFSLDKFKKIKDLSRGSKMRLAIAVALSHDAKLLLLDEATSGLDPVVRNEILDIFYDFIMDGERSIFLSSHITSDLEKIADYITFIKDGKIVLSESKEVLYGKFGILRCRREDVEKVGREYISGIRHGSFSTEVLVNDKNAVRKSGENLVIDNANIEDIMTYMNSGMGAEQ